MTVQSDANKGEGIRKASETDRDCTLLLLCDDRVEINMTNERESDCDRSPPKIITTTSSFFGREHVLHFVMVMTTDVTRVSFVCLSLG